MAELPIDTLILAGVMLAGFAVLFFLILSLRDDGAGRQLQSDLRAQADFFERMGKRLEEAVQKLERGMREDLKQGREDQNRHHVEVLKSLQVGLRDVGGEVGKRVDALTESTDKRLKDISGQVEKRLSEGFEKTNKTFNDVVARLAKIDEAQKKITELSGNVVSLQEVLADKRSRGAFGEVQLAALVRNMLPENVFALQHTLSNGTRVDCMLFLPEPTGNVAVDAKFPLESYRTMTDVHAGQAERSSAERQFKQDLRKHIKDIAEKYIIQNETASGAVMFVPAEAVFAEIHAHHADLVEEAQRANVWMTSPTTLMAVLTTARSVLKDEATRRQVHIIQEHLVKLNADFGRFQQRMDKLADHIRMAHEDTQQVQTSARKISSRFEKIEKVEIDHESSAALPDADTDD